MGVSPRGDSKSAQEVCSHEGVGVSCVLKDNGNHRNTTERPVPVRLMTKEYLSSSSAGRTRSPGFMSSADLKLCRTKCV